LEIPNFSQSNLKILRITNFFLGNPQLLLGDPNFFFLLGGFGNPPKKRVLNWAKCTVLVIQHHWGQTFGTYLGGWEGGRLSRRGCGARPREFFFKIFCQFLEKIS